MTQNGEKKEATDTGWQIRIATDNEKILINCNYSTKKRGTDGRIRPI